MFIGFYIFFTGVTHQRPSVRHATAKLFQSVVPNIPEHLVNSKVLPALITLCSDPEVSVRTSSIPTLGTYCSKTLKCIVDILRKAVYSNINEIN